MLTWRIACEANCLPSRLFLHTTLAVCLPTVMVNSFLLFAVRLISWLI